MKDIFGNDLRGAILSHRDVTLRGGFGTGSAGAGSVLVPGTVFKDFVGAVKGNYFAFRNARPLPTDDGTARALPTADDTGASAEILTDGSAGTADTSTPFTTNSFGSFCYSSGVFAASLELLMDSAMNPEEVIYSIGASRITRLLNTHIVNGTGTGQPAGLVGAATLGKTGTNGQTTSVISQDFLDVVASLDEGYWDTDRTTWLMTRATFAAACKLGHPATANEPLVSWDDAGNPRILGFKVGIDNGMPAMAASAKSIVLVNWDYVGLRIVENSFEVVVMAEKFASSGQVGFVVRGRFDSKLVIPAAARYYANSAT